MILKRRRFLSATLLTGAVLLGIGGTALRQAHAQSAGYNWKPVKLGAGGYVTGIVIHPTSPTNKYLRTDVGGAYRWETWGNWKSITDKIVQSDPESNCIESIAISPANSAELYLAAGNAIYHSYDRGDNWTKTNITVPTFGNDTWRSAGERLAVDPLRASVVYFGSRKNGLYSTTNSGGTWTGVPVSKIPLGTDGIGVTFVVFDKNRGATASGTCKVIFVGVAGVGVYRTANGGTSWTLLSGGVTPASDFVPQRGALTTAGDLYVTYAKRLDWNNPGGGAIRKYVRSVNTLTDVTPKDASGNRITGIGYGGITVKDDGSLAMATESRFSSACAFYRTTDGGASWSRVTTHPVFSESWWPSYVFGTGPAGLLIDPENPQSTWMTDGMSAWRTDDNRWDDQYWYGVSRGIEELIVQNIQFMPKKNSASAAGPLLLGVSDMAGFTHPADLSVSPPTKWSGEQFGNVTGLDYAESNPDYVYRILCDGSGNNTGSYSYNRGVDWNYFGSLPPGWNGGRIVVSSGSPDHLLYLGSGWVKPYYSWDRGGTWSEATNFPGYINCFDDFHTVNAPVAADRKQPLTYYVYGNNGEIYRTTDGGGGWTKMSSQAIPWWYRQSLKAVPHKSGEIWISFTGITGTGASQNGVYRSTDGGATWDKVAGFSDVAAFAFGAAAPGKTNTSTVYVYGTRGGVNGMFRSDDACEKSGTLSGATWTPINADYPLTHPTINGLDADKERYGVVYLGTDGRGAFIGEPR